jgi:hypothetical protein
MAHGSSGHPAYIENMSEHDGRKVAETGIWSTCKRVPEGIEEMIISF